MRGSSLAEEVGDSDDEEEDDAHEAPHVRPGSYTVLLLLHWLSGHRWLRRGLGGQILQEEG